MANVKQTSERDNNKSESFISYQAKDPDIVATTKQTKKKRKKKIQKLIFQKAINTHVSIIQQMYYMRTAVVIKCSMMMILLNFKRKWMV